MYCTTEIGLSAVTKKSPGVLRRTGDRDLDEGARVEHEVLLADPGHGRVRVVVGIDGVVLTAHRRTGRNMGLTNTPSEWSAATADKARTARPVSLAGSGARPCSSCQRSASSSDFFCRCGSAASLTHIEFALGPDTQSIASTPSAFGSSA